MKQLLTITTLLTLLTNCANPDIGFTGRSRRTPPITVPITYQVVGTAVLNISSTSGVSLATPIDTNIVYTEVEKGAFEVDTGSLVASEIDVDTLGLGSITVSKVDINKLQICSGKCTSAIIRAYTTDVTGSEGVEGFVNTTYGYGVPILMDGASVGITTANALTTVSYTIPANDRRLRNNDFNDLSYDLSVDLSNAEHGDYEMNLVLEILVGS